MSENGINATVSLVELGSKLDSLERLLVDLSIDVQYIKDIFLAKQAKKERRRQRKEEEFLKIERQRKAKQDRATYEDIIWRLDFRPWDIMPAPRSVLTPKELELASLLAQDKTDKEIALSMNIKEGSVSARICAMTNKHEVSRQDLGDYYLKYRRVFREHRHTRCLKLVRWLLNPPPGMIRRCNLKFIWKRRLGRRGSTFQYAGPYVPVEVFDHLKQREHTVMKLRVQGVDFPTIAQRLKIKEVSARGYVSEIRGRIKSTKNISLSDEALMQLYKKYLKLARKRAASAKA